MKNKIIMIRDKLVLATTTNEIKAIIEIAESEGLNVVLLLVATRI